MLALATVVTVAGLRDPGVAVGSGVGSGGGSGGSAAAEPAYRQVLERVTSDACPAASGADDDVVAVVRTPAGRVRAVSFERGWAVYTHRAPGTFLRVCVTGTT